MLNFLEHVKKRPGDKRYMLDCLATMYKGDHEYFKKGYEPPSRVQEKFIVQIDNQDDFFTGLPKSKGKDRKNLAALVSKQQRTQIRIDELN